MPTDTGGDSRKHEGLSAVESCLLVLALFFGSSWLAMRLFAATDSELLAWAVGGHVPVAVMLAGTLLIAHRHRGLVGLARRTQTGRSFTLAAACLGALGGLLVGPTSPARMAPVLSPPGQVAWALVWVGVCAPIAEELFFRGALLSSLRLHMHWLPALVLSSAAFVLAHSDTLEQWPLRLMLGAAFGSFALTPGGLGAAIACHIGWNIGTVLLAMDYGLRGSAAFLALAGLTTLLMGVARMGAPEECR